MPGAGAAQFGRYGPPMNCVVNPQTPVRQLHTNLLDFFVIIDKAD